MKNTHLGAYLVLLLEAYVTPKHQACKGLAVSMETKL